MIAVNSLGIAHPHNYLDSLINRLNVKEFSRHCQFSGRGFPAFGRGFVAEARKIYLVFRVQTGDIL